MKIPIDYTIATSKITGLPILYFFVFSTILFVCGKYECYSVSRTYITKQTKLILFNTIYSFDTQLCIFIIDVPLIQPSADFTADSSSSTGIATSMKEYPNSIAILVLCKKNLENIYLQSHRSTGNSFVQKATASND